MSEKTLHGNLFYCSILLFVRMRFMSDGCGNNVLKPHFVVRSTVLLSTEVCVPHLSCTISWLISSDFLEIDAPTRIIVCVVFVLPYTYASNLLLILMFISNSRPKLSSLETSIAPVPRDTLLVTIFGLFHILLIDHVTAEVHHRLLTSSKFLI